MKNRALLDHVSRRSESRLGRLIVLTGARQTGKTTLVQKGLPSYAYISLEDPTVRPAFLDLSAEQWHERYPVAALDEVQKAPRLVESIKATFDAHPDTRYILLGSSQILLMERVRESLAGRALLVELYPLTLPEMLTESWKDPVREARLITWLRSGLPGDLFTGMPLRDPVYARTERLLEDYLKFGGMPALVDERLTEEDRHEWLSNYIRTYLQRDVRDLANLRELEPFVRAQRTLAGLTATTVNVSSLANEAGISSGTARRFLTYLEISYQILLLPPWFRNTRKRLSKSPKVHFIDPGIQRAILGRRGAPTGQEFESAIVSEVYKQVKNSRLPIVAHHLRTADGREVDLLLEMDEGYLPIEVKMSDRVARTDARHLRGLDGILDKPVIHALVLSNDPRVRSLEEGISAVPAAWALGCVDI